MAAKIERAIRQSAGLMAGRILEAAGEEATRGDADEEGRAAALPRARRRDADRGRGGAARQARRLIRALEARLLTQRTAGHSPFLTLCVPRDRAPFPSREGAAAFGARANRLGSARTPCPRRNKVSAKLAMTSAKTPTAKPKGAACASAAIAAAAPAASGTKPTRHQRYSRRVSRFLRQKRPRGGRLERRSCRATIPR